MLDRIPNELSLLPHLQIDLVLVVRALNVRHVDGDQDVGLFALEPQEGQDQGGKVGRGRGAAPLRVGLGGLRRDEGVGGDLGAQQRELGVGRVPDLDTFDVGADNLLEVHRQRLAVDLGGAARPADALRDLDDDGREAVLVDEDFLVVGDLADLAVYKIDARGG